MGFSLKKLSIKNVVKGVGNVTKSLSLNNVGKILDGKFGDVAKDITRKAVGGVAIATGLSGSSSQIQAVNDSSLIDYANGVLSNVIEKATKSGRDKLSGLLGGASDFALKALWDKYKMYIIFFPIGIVLLIILLVKAFRGGQTNKRRGF